MRTKERQRYSDAGMGPVPVANPQDMNEEIPADTRFRAGWRTRMADIKLGDMVTESSPAAATDYIPVFTDEGVQGFPARKALVSSIAPSAAPVDAEYLVATANGTLTQERVATDTTSITWDFGTAAQAKAQRAALTGDVTASANSNATTIPNNTVTNAKADDMPANTIKANATGISNDPADLTDAGITEEAAPASGDFLLGWDSTSQLRKFDIGNLPSGAAPDVTDGTTTVSAPGELQFDGDDFDVTDNAGDAAIVIKRNVDNGIQGLDSEAKIATAVLSRRVIEHTSSQSILSEESFTIFTNKGAAGSITLSLPTAATGLEYTFVIMETQTLVIDAAAGDTIQIAGSTSAASGNISAATQGHTVTIVAMDATEWIAHSVVGSWSVT